MPGIGAAYEYSAFCLQRQDGPQAGLRYKLRSPLTRIGRAPDNDVVVAGADSRIVSARHAEIRVEDGRWILRDLESTNGTFVDGERCSEAEVQADSVIQLGPGGPTLVLTAWDGIETPPLHDQTLRVAPEPAAPGLGTANDRVLQEAVANARRARWSGALNQTGAIMRYAVAAVVARSARRFWIAIVCLIVLLAAVGGLGAWKIRTMSQEKAAIDARIGRLELAIASAVAEPVRMDRLIDELDREESQAASIAHDPLYRWGTPQQKDRLDGEIRSLLGEFGAEEYSIPPEFRESVKRELSRYLGDDRPLMARALGEAEPEMGRIARVLAEDHLPPDLSYMVLVESAMDPSGRSAAGCVGLWQLTPATARAFGLRVGKEIDERLNLLKATHAAARYLRNLILDFGAGKSVMLALAAYDVGPSRVKKAISRVTDPIRQRDFWYLYRAHALPEETREYVPKVIAAMIIGRDPARYGFEPARFTPERTAAGD